MPAHWDDVARLRAEQIEAGLDLTFSEIFVPFYQRLIGQAGPRRVLEVGAGTGHLARELVTLAGAYVMLEPSSGMFEVARRVLSGTQVELLQMTLQEYSPDSAQFDWVISHMCLQTLDDLDSFMGALVRVLDERGRYALSLPHPAFYNEYKGFFDKESFCYAEERSARIDFTITLDPGRPITGVPYYHRPIARYVRSLAAKGLNIDMFEEVYPDAVLQARYGSRWKTPRYLVIGGGKSQIREPT